MQNITHPKAVATAHWLATLCQPSRVAKAVVLAPNLIIQPVTPRRIG